MMLLILKVFLGSSVIRSINIEGTLQMLVLGVLFLAASRLGSLRNYDRLLRLGNSGILRLLIQLLMLRQLLLGSLHDILSTNYLNILDSLDLFGCCTIVLSEIVETLSYNSFFWQNLNILLEHGNSTGLPLTTSSLLLLFLIWYSMLILRKSSSCLLDSHT